MTQAKEEAAQEMQARGLKGSEIAVALGVSRTTVRRLLDPGLRERSREQSNEAKRRRTGTCVDCGATTRYNGIDVSERCQSCASKRSGGRKKVWTRELLIHAILEFANEFGEPPAMADWNPTKAAFFGDVERVERAKEARWPHAISVIREFGSWNAGLVAAGFAPRVPNGGGGNSRRRQKKAVSM